MAQGYDYGSGYQYGIPLPASELGDSPAAVYVKGVSFTQSGNTVTVTVINQDDEETTSTFETGSDAAITGISLSQEGDVYTITATTAGGDTSTIGTITIPEVDTSSLVNDVSVTNENGVYTIHQTKGTTTTDAGTIEVQGVSTDNLISGIDDEVTEDNTNGYDRHELKATKNDGTESDVGSFYLAKYQILSAWYPTVFRRVSQDGSISSTPGFSSYAAGLSSVTMTDTGGATPNDSGATVIRITTTIYLSTNSYSFTTYVTIPELPTTLTAGQTVYTARHSMFFGIVEMSISRASTGKLNPAGTVYFYSGLGIKSAQISASAV